MECSTKGWVWVRGLVTAGVVGVLGSAAAAGPSFDIGVRIGDDYAGQRHGDGDRGHDASRCGGGCEYGCRVPVAGTLRIDGHRFIINDRGNVAEQIAAKARWLGYDAEVCGGREVVIYGRRGCTPQVSWAGDRYRGYVDHDRRKVVLSVERVKVECREEWHPGRGDRYPRRDPAFWWYGRRDRCW